MFGVATVAAAEPQARDGTPTVQAEGTLLAGLFRRTFDGGRCGPGGCPKPEPDVPDDPPPVKVEPKQEPAEIQPSSSVPPWAYGLAVIAAAGFALFTYFRRGGGE
jgi:hypothetical protein